MFVIDLGVVLTVRIKFLYPSTLGLILTQVTLPKYIKMTNDIDFDSLERVAETRELGQSVYIPQSILYLIFEVLYIDN